MYNNKMCIILVSLQRPMTQLAFLLIKKINKNKKNNEIKYVR